MLKYSTIFIMCLVLLFVGTNKNSVSADVHIDAESFNGVLNSKIIECMYNSKNTSSDIDDLEVFNYQNNKILVSKEDLYLMAQVVFAESRAEPFDGKVAVASVILNRLIDPQFPDTIEGVIKQKAAFSCIINNQISVIPDNSCFDAVYAALGGEDPTDFALFYYNPEIATCGWMKSIQKSNIKQIGNHVFFVVN